MTQFETIYTYDKLAADKDGNILSYGEDKDDNVLAYSYTEEHELTWSEQLLHLFRYRYRYLLTIT